MYRLAWRQAATRVAALRRPMARSQAVRTAALVTLPLVGYGVWQYQTSQPILNDTKNELDASEVDTKTKLLDEKDLLSKETASDEEQKSDSKVPHDNKLGSEEQQQQQEAQAQEDEEQPQGAFNPETGEINWDCPCLGGMAEGPCGEEFKQAFSCFVYSEAEPKGVDCIEKFSAMQSCFRQYPDYYSEQLREEDPMDAQQDNKDQQQSQTAREESAQTQGEEHRASKPVQHDETRVETPTTSPDPKVPDSNKLSSSSSTDTSK